MTSRVVILNGVGSAGKSSIARALQAVASVPLLHVPMDVFLDMLPEHTFESPEGVSFEQQVIDGHPEVRIHSGPTSERALYGMRHAVAAMALAGNHLVVDEVATWKEIQEYRELLTDVGVTVVKVDASLEVLEQRERDRKDRVIGLARGQFSTLHVGIEYDLVVDAERLSPTESAAFIASAADL